MKSLYPIAVAAAVLFMTAQAMAQLPNQPVAIEPASGDHGPFAVQLWNDPADPDLAKAYDNFTLDADYFIDGFCWTGLYAEPFPTVPSNTDFIVQIWGTNTDAASSGFGHADVHAGPILEFDFEGGHAAGLGGADLAVTSLGTAPASAGGGEEFSYEGGVDRRMLAAGDYWISILANQLFENNVEVDPEWQWHLAGDGDGFTAFDRTLDPPGTLQSGIFQADKDLAFQIKGEMVPEPSSALLAAFGLFSLGLIRRKRS